MPLRFYQVHVETLLNTAFNFKSLPLSPCLIRFIILLILKYRPTILDYAIMHASMDPTIVSWAVYF